MKVWNYVFMAIMLILVTKFFGMDTGATGAIGNFTSIDFGNSTNPTVTDFDPGISSLWDYLWNASSGVLLALSIGIFVGVLARGRSENFILMGFASAVLVLFIQVFVGIWEYTTLGWARTIISLIFIPITVGYILALVEFFRGTD